MKHVITSVKTSLEIGFFYLSLSRQIIRMLVSFKIKNWMWIATPTI